MRFFSKSEASLLGNAKRDAEENDSTKSPSMQLSPLMHLSLE